jgi:hypothetical protein
MPFAFIQRIAGTMVRKFRNSSPSPSPLGSGGLNYGKVAQGNDRENDERTD